MRHPHGFRAAAGNVGPGTVLPDMPNIGDPFEGGYYAGLISHTADGNPTHALIVSPAATGYNSALKWKSANTSTSGTLSEYDGAANTVNMYNQFYHYAAVFCVELSIGGYSDWYLPARYELDIAYYNLKPTTQSNNTSWGINNYSVPQRTVNYTAGDPAQTSAAAFQEGGAEAFATGDYWSSTEYSAGSAWTVSFSNGVQYNFYSKKGTSLKVRAFRKIAL